MSTDRPRCGFRPRVSGPAAARPGRPRWRADVRRRAAVLAVAVLLACGAFGAAAQGATELGASVESLLEHARARSPELAALRHETQAAAQRVLPAGALPDPMFRVELENFNNYGRSAAPNLLPSRVGETKYTLLQSFPAWGKRDLRRDLAQTDVQQAQARAAAAWTDLAARIKAAYARYYLAAGTERITLELVDLISRLEQIAQARYAGGLAVQQDAIRAQLERTAMRSELIALDSEKRQLRARLNALLARDASEPLAEPRGLRPAGRAAALDAAALAQRVRSNNPALQAEDARLRGAQANRALALRNRYPDLQLGISPKQMGSRITTWGLMVEVNIPLQQDTRRAQEREAESMVDAARERAQALANQLLGELGENLAGIAAAQRSEALITAQLLPQSELSLRAALAAYENGKVDFATVLDAQRQIRRAQLDRLKAQVEAQLRLAEIERILGEDL